jgi:hypothetical protein
MPTYRFSDSATGEEFERFMTISEYDAFVLDNPHLKQVVNGCPLIHSGRGLSKPDAGFRELLSRIKDGNSRGMTKSTIDTY